MSAKTQSNLTFSRKVRKHYEIPVQLNPEKRKNLVLGHHFRYPRLPKWWTRRPENARRPAGPPPAFTARRARARSGRKTYRSGRLLPPPSLQYSQRYCIPDVPHVRIEYLASDHLQPLQFRCCWWNVHGLSE